MTKKNKLPQTKVKNPEPDLSDEENWTIWAAWADRITFEEIFRKVGKTESDVIKLMRKKLRPSSFKLWRKRVRHQSIKNEKMFKYKRRELNRRINLEQD